MYYPAPSLRTSRHHAGKHSVLRVALHIARRQILLRATSYGNPVKASRGCGKLRCTEGGHDSFLKWITTPAVGIHRESRARGERTKRRQLAYVYCVYGVHLEGINAHPRLQPDECGMVMEEIVPERLDVGEGDCGERR